ncbi:MAG: 4Fe-4S binding protein [Euryarchaeota archaeon]|nr:4Fe-4S binding protein [Euryarchaeota archaeon]MBU4340338.1 4Fe-4S binding protein [Euryarchaeota archaeon]MBU4453882.1 4Fe-4S binding protein [Euryarchaeota archaeon]MCG2737418.1 4Fe-4S binding protein [Candidatus Methanoperedenaceae archaeon]
MKQLAIISGKGGTGKTTLAAAFASLAENAVLADCDVDAADLHLILNPEIKEAIEFSGSKIASKDDEKCTRCGKCKEYCRFDAINEDLNLVEDRCEGCGVCEYVCPEGAITLIERKSGFAYISETRFGPMSHAVLNTAEEASGKLVALVRNNARILAKKYRKDLIIIDGPPGIGCPVIAAISGADLVLIVTEPTLSGIHDMERIIGVANHFNIPAVVCINKFDINHENTLIIEEYCEENGLEVVGKIPYDETPTKAMIQEKTIIEFSDSEFSNNVKNIWENIRRKLK